MLFPHEDLDIGKMTKKKKKIITKKRREEKGTFLRNGREKGPQKYLLQPNRRPSWGALVRKTWPLVFFSYEFKCFH